MVKEAGAMRDGSHRMHRGSEAEAKARQSRRIVIIVASNKSILCDAP